MHRFRKPVMLASACALALFATVRGSAPPARAQPGVPAAGGRPERYDLGQLTVLTKALFQINEAYFDKSRFDPRRMLLGALDSLQREVPEILVDRLPEANPTQARVRVGSEEQVFDLQAIDSPWSLRGIMQRIFRFVQPRLNPVPPAEEARRLLAIEIAATNGVLATLDPHSIVLDAEGYREMRAQTQGRFGGVGMSLIEDRKRGIVVRSLIPDTPAVRAGLLARDRIVRINDESTVNMTVTEAVERLRGEVGARVDIYVERDGVEGPRKISVVRDTIHPSSIERARVLTSRAAPGQTPAKIGYFRIDHFSASTESDMMATLDRFEREKVRGLIIDLRDNPGGLYDQAATVADAFINAGTLVSLVGVGGAQRRDEAASSGGQLKLPLAVLVDERSASASEIVAGAIKNLDRGVIIGDTTFGKGSVQLLFDLPSPLAGPRPLDEDRLGLKLTTAQYLTAGNASIQGVGVVPDVALLPMLVDKHADQTLIRLQRSAHRRQESDLEASLTQAGARKTVLPAETVPYLHVPPPGQPGPAVAASDPDDEDAEGPPDVAAALDAAESHVDFAMELARDLLAQAHTADRARLLADSAAFFARVRAEQDERVKGAVEKLGGVDWSAGETRAAAARPAVLRATLSVVASARPVPAGQTVRLRAVVKNTGTVAAHRVRLVLDSPNLLLDEDELVLGRIGPQETRSFEQVVKIPAGSLTRTDSIVGRVLAQTPIQANSPEATLDIAGKPRPLFAYSYRTVDPEGNRDGRVQRGEKLRLLVTIKNIGPGPALRAEVVLRNGLGQPGILISAGRFQIKELAPGASREVAFSYQVGPEFKGDGYRLQLSVGDSLLRESVTDTIKVAISPPAAAPGGAAAPPPVLAGQVTPPVLTVSAPTVTTSGTVRLTGRAVDDQRVRDVYVRVYNRGSKLPLRKVLYLPNRGQPTTLEFDAEVPVRPGSNLIEVFARENDQVETVATLVVLQKPVPRLVQAR
jgi:carboxyl-terminal processing protease